VAELQKNIQTMYNLVEQVLICRSPSPSYSIFLYEQMTLFKIKAVKEGRPHKIALSFDFMDTFSHSEIEEQHLLCELYLHEFACPMDRRYNITPLVGDIQIRSFTSFVNNHVTWRNAFQTVRKNEVNASLWIRGEPLDANTIIKKHQDLLSQPEQANLIIELQRMMLESCRCTILKQQSLALDGSKSRWEVSTNALRSRDPYHYGNFTYALSRIEGYINCVQSRGARWLGLKFHFPLIWMPLEKYQPKFRITKKMEKQCWERIAETNGFRKATEKTEGSYSFNNLHWSGQLPNSDSE